MASFPVMLFLISLLFPSMLTKGRTQKESIVSVDHETNGKAVLNKIDCQGEGNILETLERILCDSHQNQTLAEDLAKDNKHTVDLCTFLTGLSKSCAQKHPVDLVNYRNMVHRTLEFTVRSPLDNLTSKNHYVLVTVLDLLKGLYISQ
ncbi:exocrine gland-secreted peptide 1-like isoform X2 [Mesocricetus auratus]|uniref:Exocrine gland-secreted peptide 1-like isoform X2 n=1 Tax=Mesocricetus auratus TaxID=10036 RepID=A0ABM2WB16_MESAU|nr:exocrine gland-secreted peptide 1-like isoform X2 [Mesocricetus auratus]